MEVADAGKPRYEKAMTVLPRKEPLLEGESKSTSMYLPKALISALERQAAIDGYKKLSPYIADLLVFALRMREAEQQVLKK